MAWALGASLVINGFLLGAYVGIYMAQSAQEPQPVENDVPGGGIAQDPDMDYEWDKTVIGFRGPSGK